MFTFQMFTERTLVGHYSENYCSSSRMLDIAKRLFTKHRSLTTGYTFVDEVRVTHGDRFGKVVHVVH